MIGAGVRLNGTFVIGLPFQTVVDFSSNLYTSFTTVPPEVLSLLSKSRIFLFNVPFALFSRRMT